MGDRDEQDKTINQTNRDGGDNVAGDEHEGDRIQQGVIGNDNATIQIGTLEQKFEAPKPPERTGVEPPNNLGDRGIRKAAQFVGREEAIADLHSRLQRSERVAIAGVAGMGGVGKTELAVQYGRRFLRSEYGGGVVWLSGAQGVTDLLSFAQGVLFPDQKLAEIGDEAAIVQFIWNRWPAPINPPEPVLVIFDDVTDYGAQVVPVLPTNNDPRFRVVVTTRQKLEGIERLDLDVLLPGDAITLLGVIAGKERVAAERETAAAICEWLGFLPLAVELVGYFLKKKAGLSLAEMLLRLQGKRAESKALNPKRLPEGLTARRGVLDAFELSWQELGAEAQELAMRLSLFASAPIPWEVVEDCCWEMYAEDLEEWRDEELIRLCLLKQDEENTYTLHPLIQDFLIAKSSANAERTVWESSLILTLVQLVADIPRYLSLSQQSFIRRLLPHLETGMRYIDWLDDEEFLYLPIVLIRFYLGQSQWQEAHRICLMSIRQYQERYGANVGSISVLLNQQAEIYTLQGQYLKAEAILQQALKLVETDFEEDNVFTGTILNNLGENYQAQRQYELAIPFLRRALRVFLKDLGKNNLHTVNCLRALAYSYRYSNRINIALLFMRRVLRVQQAELGEMDFEVSTSLGQLAGMYLQKRDYELAEFFYRQMLMIDELTIGVDNPNTALVFSSLSVVYCMQSRWKEAEECILPALHAQIRMIGPEHTRTQEAFQNHFAIVREALQAKDTEQLSDHPLTRAILQQLQQENPDLS